MNHHQNKYLQGVPNKIKTCSSTNSGTTGHFFWDTQSQVNQVPSLLVEGLLSIGPTQSSFYFLVEMGLPLHIFPAYIWWELDQLFLKRHNHKYLKLRKLFLGPIQTRLIAFLGLLGKTKVKAYTNLTIVMCCQKSGSLLRHLVAIFIRDRLRVSSVGKIRNFEKTQIY